MLEVLQDFEYPHDANNPIDTRQSRQLRHGQVVRLIVVVRVENLDHPLDDIDWDARNQVNSKPAHQIVTGKHAGPHFVCVGARSFISTQNVDENIDEKKPIHNITDPSVDRCHADFSLCSRFVKVEERHLHWDINQRIEQKEDYQHIPA